MADLADLGWSAELADAAGPPGDGAAVARVVTEHRGAYVVSGPHGELEAAVSPELRDAAGAPEDFPAVGDWVMHSTESRDDRRVAITRVLPRRSLLVRRAPGSEPVPQVVAANVDVVAVVVAATEDRNERRAERFLAVAFGSGGRPVLVVNKVDAAAVDPSLVTLAARCGVPLVAASAVDGTGVADLRDLVGSGTAVFVGPSGVGKSSLANAILGVDVMSTADVRADGRGRHTTVTRELLVVPGGGVLIDTPGLREVQLWDRSGLDATFPDIAERAERCRFADCRHVAEPGCAVRAAVDSGDLHEARVSAYVGLAAEVERLDEEIEVHERSRRRRRDARRR